VVPDTALFRVYRELIDLRRKHLRLFVDGSLQWLRTDDPRGVLAYERVLDGRRAVVAFNVADAPVRVSVPAQGQYQAAFPAGGPVTVTGGTLNASLPARSVMVWINREP
jgi:glycosidase